MTFDKTTLPAPPEFPTSNASYNSIVGKMHKAALCASTAASAIAAVSAIKEHVGGVNTYAKKVRKYGDELVAAIKGEPAADMTAGQVVALIGDEAGPTLVEEAAAEGDPIAGFMLKGAKAQAAVDEAAFKGKAYSNKSNAKRALKAAALDHLPVEWQPDGTFVRPVVIVTDAKGVAYANERGFPAKVAA